jgi:hypothetical protein
LSVPRHAAAYSPRWDAQLGLWTDKAVEARLNQRQIHENQVFNLAAAQASAEHGLAPLGRSTGDQPRRSLYTSRLIVKRGAASRDRGASFALT